MALGAGTRLGPYEIVELRGKGGMGEVYLGRDTRLERDVAIKVHLSPTGYPRTLHEVWTAGFQSVFPRSV